MLRRGLHHTSSQLPIIKSDAPLLMSFILIFCLSFLFFIFPLLYHKKFWIATCYDLLWSEQIVLTTGVVVFIVVVI